MQLMIIILHYVILLKIHFIIMIIIQINKINVMKNNMDLILIQ